MKMPFNSAVNKCDMPGVKINYGMIDIFIQRLIAHR